jgi:hypothetical protein
MFTLEIGKKIVALILILTLDTFGEIIRIKCTERVIVSRKNKFTRLKNSV